MWNIFVARYDDIIVTGDSVPDTDHSISEKYQKIFPNIKALAFQEISKMSTDQTELLM